MGVFDQFPMLTIFVIVVATFLIVSIFKSRRGPSRQAICPQCGASLPARARFCNRCGQKLDIDPRRPS
jgi:predicted amidophosphoribosyltransferase